MGGEITKSMERKNQRGLFSAKQLQLSIAVIAVVTLLGGALLQTGADWALERFDLSLAAYILILIGGYVSLILLLCAFFVYKLVGPFRRLEYEMKLIASGELTRRLSVRDGDDLHVRRFISNVNALVANFEEMSREYNRLNNIVDTKLVEINEDLLGNENNVDMVGKEIKMLQEEIHILREKW